jgi:hypothetical protein
MLEPVGAGLMHADNKPLQFRMSQKGKIRKITPELLVIKSCVHNERPQL